MPPASHCCLYPPQKHFCKAAIWSCTSMKIRLALSLQFLQGRNVQKVTEKTMEIFLLRATENWDQRKNASSCLVICLQNQWVSKQEQYALAAWPLHRQSSWQSLATAPGSLLTVAFKVCSCQTDEDHKDLFFLPSAHCSGQTRATSLNRLSSRTTRAYHENGETETATETLLLVAILAKIVIQVQSKT